MSASRRCEMCPAARPSLAVVFCDADACFLCAACDEEVHGANRLAQRHRRRAVTSLDDHPTSEESDILVPDVDAGNAISRLPSNANDSDVGYADFDEFEGHFGKMPALSTSDADSMFESLVPSHAGLKAFDSDLSWESVVPDEFEHVVPDIEEISMVSSLPKVAPVPVVKSEPMTVRTHTLCDASVPVCPADFVITSRPPTGLGKHTLKLESPSTSNLSGSSSSVRPSSSPLNVSKEAGSVPRSDVAKYTTTLPASDREQPGQECEVKTVEQRKQMRAEALVRFRAKRANRSFRKKIRYGCRKVLAESRPRVKGRFVKKCDMALYALHGANYIHFKEAASLNTSSPVAMEMVAVVPSL